MKTKLSLLWVVFINPYVRKVFTSNTNAFLQPNGYALLRSQNASNLPVVVLLWIDFRVIDHFTKTIRLVRYILIT